MSKKVFNKLIRDRIPEIIRENGQRCKTRILSDAEYLGALDAKLSEELQEYLESGALEELADLLEVIRAVIAARGGTMEEVEAIRTSKAEARGGFDRKLFLEYVENDL